MEKDFVDSWERHKEELRTYIEASSQKELESYQALVKILFQIVINPDLKDAPYDTDKIIVIDDGDYQGTQIYILRQAVYQPCVENYVYTHVYYGSCSGCDTLQSICCQGGLPVELDENEKPSPDQVISYMQLLLHLLQRTKQFQDNDAED